MKIQSRRFILIFFALVIGIALVAAVPHVQAASFRPEKSTNGAVIATSKFATDAGMQVLRSGGNAVDAAVAVGYTMAATHPVAGNLGGGGFAIIRTADGKILQPGFPGDGARQGHPQHVPG